MSSSDRKQAFKAFEVVKHATLKICNSAGDVIGTGFFVSSEGHFVTCAHVVADADGIGKLIANGHVGITECYIGDANKDDIALLQVIDHKSPIFLHLVDLPEDQTFRSYGFSNEIYRDGAPIEGKIVGLATSTDSTLLNQRVLRLVTEGDSQAIKGGQSGAAVCVYNAKKKQWQAVGILVASEGENGGIALPITNAVRQLIPVDPNILRWKVAKIIIGITAISLVFSSFLWVSLRKCPDERILGFTTSIDTLLKTDLIKAIELSEKFEKECPVNAEALISNGFVIREKAIQTNPKNRDDLQLAKLKFQELQELLDSPENKNHIKATYGLGVVLYDMEKYEEAIKELKKIEDKESVKTSVWYYIGDSYVKLTDFNNAEVYFKYIIKYFRDRRIPWNEINSQKDIFFSYHRDALLNLIYISETMWYLNRNDSIKSQIYYSNYKKYNESLLVEVILPKNRKSHLDNLAESIMDSPLESTDKSSDYVRSTNEYKKMICGFYERYSTIEKAVKLQSQCKL